MEQWEDKEIRRLVRRVENAERDLLTVTAERDDLRAKLDAANTELHELRIRAGRVAELEANEQKLRGRLEEVLDSLHRRFDGK